MASWQQIEIEGRPADAYIPARDRAGGATVLFLHGLGQTTLRGSAAFTGELERHGLRCLCPMGRRTWWGDRPCAEFDARFAPQTYLREYVLPWLARHWGARPPAVALLGVSVGGQGVLRLAYKAPAEFPVVAALAPAIDFHQWYGRGFAIDQQYPSAEHARQDTATVLLNPLNWPRHQFLACDPADADCFEGVERLISKLNSTGIPFESDLATTCGGHTWKYLDALAPAAVAFLASRLEQERLRLPTLVE